MKTSILNLAVEKKIFLRDFIRAQQRTYPLRKHNSCDMLINTERNNCRGGGSPAVHNALSRA